MWPIFSSKPWWADLFLVYVADFFVTPWWGDLFLICVADVFRQTLMEWSVLVHVADFFRIPCWIDLFFLSTWPIFSAHLAGLTFFFYLRGRFFASKPWWSDLFFVYMADFSSNLHGVTFFRIQIAIIKALNWQYWLNQKLGFTIMILVDVAGFSSKPSWSDLFLVYVADFFLQTLMGGPFFSLCGRCFSPNLDGVTCF